jgi:hypothetical protein
MDGLDALSGCPMLTHLKVRTVFWGPSKVGYRFIRHGSNPQPSCTWGGRMLCETLRSLELCSNMLGSQEVQWVEQLQGITTLSLGGISVTAELGR